jgi:hypothetical protein
MTIGKIKGGEFERAICKKLSRWVTDGEREDVFWRSAMSGGRATIRGTEVRQAGDICAVAEEGWEFCNKWFVECKHVKELNIIAFFLKKESGELRRFWEVARDKAALHSRVPMLIACQNRVPIIVLSKGFHLAGWTLPIAVCYNQTETVDITLLDDLLGVPYDTSCK